MDFKSAVLSNQKEFFLHYKAAITFLYDYSAMDRIHLY